jgi:hypothetical protein
MTRPLAPLLLCLGLCAAAATPAAEPAAPASEAATAAQLTATVTALDNALFSAFNGCDLRALGDFVSDDLEFYHDKDGLSRGRAVFLAAIKNNICGKVRRELVPGSLEVYPINHYGAMEMGAHMFCDPRQVQRCDPAKSGIARFVMLWQNEAGSWKLTRVISFDHLSDWQRPPAKAH